MSGKRPPPLPIRPGRGVRPPPPMVPAVPAVVGASSGSLGIKIAIGLGFGTVLIVLLASGTLGVIVLLRQDGKGGGASGDSRATAQAVQKEKGETPPEPEANPSPQNSGENSLTTPNNHEPQKAAPVEPPKKTNPPKGNDSPASTEKTSPSAKTPPPANAANPPLTSPEPPPSGTKPPESPPAPTPPSSTSAFDDVRQRGNILSIPEPKISEYIELAKLEVAKPSDCTLSIDGADELGQAIKAEPVVDSVEKRTWTILLKGSGGLNKDRAIADFTLSNKTLGFQWRPGVASNSFPLHFCLLKVAVGGESETCRLAKPVPLPPLKITPGETSSIELTLPVGIVQKASVLRLEVTPIDFPSVQFQANQGLKTGDNTTLTVTGSASGTISPDLEFDVKFECVGGKAVLRIASLAPWPPDAKGKIAKNKVSALLLDAKKKEVAKKIPVLKKRKTLLEGDKAKLEKEETLLGNFMPRTFDERNLLAQKQAQLTQEVVAVQTALDTCVAQHDAAAASVQWCDDMLALCKDLETRSRLGIRIYREVGKEVIEIVATDANAAP